MRRQSYAARANWIARGLGGSAILRSRLQGAGEAEMDMDEAADDLWESVMVDHLEQHNFGSSNEEDAALAEALEQRRRIGSALGGQRLLDAVRAFSRQQGGSHSAGAASRAAAATVTATDATELLQRAAENTVHYQQPTWMDPSELIAVTTTSRSSRMGSSARTNNTSNSIQVSGTTSQQGMSLAHLPLGSEEGRPVRACDPLPRPSVARKVGFKVVFDSPTTDQGGNMGGCHLVGVTTTAFSAYRVHNGLQQSAFFWGIEDSGQKYEGSQTNSRRRSEFTAVDAPMNASNCLFGSQEVIMVVCDYDSRSLSFWRDGLFLGTLVSNLPRTGQLYPVAVPFNGGVTVAICRLDVDPLPAYVYPLSLNVVFGCYLIVVNLQTP